MKAMKVVQPSAARPFRSFVVALAGMSGLAVLLYVMGAVRGNGSMDWYLNWNLFLAWIPMVLAYVLVRRLRTHAWSSWPCLALSLVWLLFLPNSFYMVSDFIHLADMPRSEVLYDSLTFTVYILNAMILGYTGLFLVQQELEKRVARWKAVLTSASLLFLCSFAIYLGRDLRWNSWDVLVNPAGILFDVSERILDPSGHPETFVVTGVFFVFLMGLYLTLSGLVKAIGEYARAASR